MPCECSINRSASSSSSLERSVDKRGPATGDGASVVAGLDMIEDEDDVWSCRMNAHCLGGRVLWTRESAKTKVLREHATHLLQPILSSSDNLGEYDVSWRPDDRYGRRLSTSYRNKSSLMDCAGYQIWLRDVYDGMLNLPARPREQQETKSTRSRS